MNRRVALCLAPVLILCACERRNKLGAPTAVVEISPSVASLPAGAQKVFTARVLTPGGEVVDAVPEWTMSAASLGTLSPQTGSRVTLTAGQALGVQGTLRAVYGDVAGTAQIWIGGSTMTTASAYGFYTESLPNRMQFDVNNPPNADGATLGTFAGSTGGCSAGAITLSDGTQIGEFTEGTKGLKASVSDQGNPSAYCAGYYMIYGVPFPPSATRNLSAFAGGTLRFDIRAPAGKEIYVKIESGGCVSCPELALAGTVGVTFDDTFRSVSIPLSSFSPLNLSQFKSVVFSVHSPSAVGTFSFYLDNLRIES